jgi:predicted RecB family endonuclease
MVQGKAAMRSSESIAANLLQQMGYKVVEMHKKVTINNIEISDVDIVTEKNGIKYAVEVKAGPADVSSIRQIYVNSKLLNMVPMIISRGLADEKAEELAKELNVIFISVSDQVLTNLGKLPRPHGRSFGVSSGLHDAPSSPLRGVYVPPTHTSR